MTQICLGIDQSTTLTGLCLCRYRSADDWDFIRCDTYETPGYIAMRKHISDFIMLDYPDVVICEDAFYGRSATAHKAAVRSATWVEAVVMQYKLGRRFEIVPATTWRAKVWGPVKRMKSPEAKQYSIDYARSLGVPVDNDHEADAFGMCRYGILTDTEATDERN